MSSVLSTISKSSMSTSYPSHSSSLASSSIPTLLSTTPSVSTQTITGLTEELTLATSTPDSSKPTGTLNSTVTVGNEISASTSRPGESLTTSVGDGHMTTSSSLGSTLYTSSSDGSMPSFSTHSLHSTNSASPSPSSPSEISTHTVVSQHTTTTAKESTSGFSSPVSSTSPGSTGTPVPGFSTTSTLHPPFTRTQTTVRTTHSSTMTPWQCYNGGIWNGKECICAQGYLGYQCKSLKEYFSIETPQKINATVDLKVKVTNRNFTDDLKDNSSAAYKNFVQVFKSRMDEVYRGNNFPQYRGVNVKRLLRGSVMVEHEVIMEANYTSGYLELFENLTKIVRAKIMSETGQLHGNSKECKNLSLLCYDETATSVDPVKVDFDPQEQCTKKAAKEFAQFYYVDELDGKLACVTKCTPGTKSEMDCHHGRCQLQQSGPRCLCLNSDTHWYSGETCESSTSKSMVYGIVGAVVALLVVLVVVLIVLLSRSQRKRHRRQEYDVSREWQDAGYPGSFENTSIWEGQDLKGDTFGLENIYRNFQPSLRSVDPTTELHIQRPTVVTTAQ
ncbi:mucin-12 [Bos mutus]|uniref:mucin-12 n=1 Tax=Bos mutus TaxID=72004 RepID=UPI0006D913E5|nr:PREDICTED: mucin-12 [Bos mutus]